MTNDRHGNGPGERVASARADANAAQRRLEQASRSRLQELMQLSPRARLAHINDVDLVATDRANLRRSVQAQLPIRRLSWRWRRSWLFRRSWLDGFSPATFATGIACAALLILFLAAGWGVTAAPYVLPKAKELRFRMPEGGLLWLTIPAGTKFGVQQRNNIPTERLWLHGRGYAWTQLYARSSWR